MTVVIGLAINARNAATGGAGGGPPSAVLMGLAVVALVAAVAKRLKLAGEAAETGDESVRADAGDDAGADAANQGPIALLVLSSLVGMIVLVILLLALPRMARAQGAASTSVTWVFARGTDTVSVERVTRGRSSLNGDIAMRGLPRIAYVAELAEGPSVPVLTFQVYGTGAAPDAAPLQTGALRVGADSTSIEASAGGNTQRASRPMTGRPIPLIARFYPLFYRMDSLIDTVSTLSQRTSLYQEEGGRMRSVTTTFDRRTRQAEFTPEQDPTHRTVFTVPQNVQDGLATLYALRTHAFRAGEHLTIPVADEGQLYTASFDVSGPEAVKVPMGVVDAWSLRVTILDAANQPVGRNIGAWMSTDARRLPVKLEAELPVGTFALTLRSAQ